MVDPLFTMFLGKVGDASLGWGVGRVLDVVAKCFKCSEENCERISNKNTNFIECKNCGVTANQFTHACDSTIRRDTRQIGHASIGFEDAPFTAKYGLFSTDLKSISIPWVVKLDGLHQRTVKIDLILGGAGGTYDSPMRFTTHKVVSPRKPSEKFNFVWTLEHLREVRSRECRSFLSYMGRSFRPGEGVLEFQVIATTDSGKKLGNHKRFVEYYRTKRKT